MAESQKGVGTDAITAIIAAMLALANALEGTNLSDHSGHKAIFGAPRICSD
jgi:hypothetical protein